MKIDEREAQYLKASEGPIEAIRLSTLHVPIEAWALSIEDSCRAIGVKTTSIYKLVKERKLRLVKVGSRSFITVDSIKMLMRNAVADGSE